MSLDVIVVNYRTPVDLAGFLASYEEHPAAQETNLHIVNVAADDLSRSVAFDGCLLPGHIVFYEFERMDYGRAANLAAQGGEADTVAVFNADTMLSDGLLDGCYQTLWSDEDFGVVGPRQIDDKNRLTSAGIFGSHSQPQHRGWYEPDRGQYTDIEEAVMVPGSAFFFKRYLWDELTSCPIYQARMSMAVGPLLETHYFSDTWPCYHAAAHGKKVVYDGSHTMLHKWHRSTKMGGYAEQTMAQYKKLFRELCDSHGLEHD